MLTRWRPGRAAWSGSTPCAVEHDEAQFFDVDYFELIREPIRTVENIYSHFGIEMTEKARAAIQRTEEESKQGPRAPKHTYSLSDYGLTEEQVRERFKGL